MTPNLPASVLAHLELSPVEDVMLYVLRDAFPDLSIRSLLSTDPEFPLVLVRRSPGLGESDGDPRFVDAAIVDVHVFAQDPDGDEAAALISEAVRVALRNAWLAHARVPGRGSIIKVAMTSTPHRSPDWATSSGPVQYADLPAGTWRYEASYHVTIRKERKPAQG